MMNIPMMDSYLENLAGYICDEDKLVTYKWLSKELEVHVNIAKIILWRYWQKYKNKGQLVATFMLIGNLKSGGMRVEVVMDSDLAKAREKFEKIISEHVYSLQKVLANIELLALSGKGDSRYSAITCDKSVILSDEELLKMRWGKASVPQGAVLSEKKVDTPRKIDTVKDAQKSTNLGSSEGETKIEEKPARKISPPSRPKANERKGAVPKKPVQSTKTGFGNLFGKAANQQKTGSSLGSSKIGGKDSGSLAAQKSTRVDVSLEKTKPEENEKKLLREDENARENVKSTDASKKNEKARENEINTDPTMKNENSRENKKNTDASRKNEKTEKEKSPDSSKKNDETKEKSSKKSQKNSASSSSSKEVASERDKSSEKIEKPAASSKKSSGGKKNNKINNRGTKRGRSKDSESETKKRKRIFVASDSSEDSAAAASDEEDMFESPPSPEAFPDEKRSPSPPLIKQDGNKRKVRKLVDNTFVDEEGYLITKKIHVYESCSEEEPEVTETKKKTEPEVAKETKPSVKKKQTTLMNFFKKA